MVVSGTVNSVVGLLGVSDFTGFLSVVSAGVGCKLGEGVFGSLS